ncbi:VOC family protein [soil metagenome]
MPSPGLRPEGSPVWIDLNSSDRERSIAFYSNLFGWEVEEAEGLGHYQRFRLDGHLVAGLYDSDPGALDNWLTYLKTSEPEATGRAIRDKGGKVVVFYRVTDLGTMVHAVDPAGAPIAAWASDTFSGFEVVNEPGAPAWHELHTFDYAKALRFYSAAFGVEPVAMPGAPQFQMSTWGDGTTPTAGIYAGTDQLPLGVPARWENYFLVADTDAAADDIVNLGGTIRVPATDSPFGRFARAADVTGATFSIVAPQ